MRTAEISIASASALATKLTTNSGSACRFRQVSVLPSMLNMTIGGSSATPLKYECGARLSTPSAERVDTQAMGRGTIRAVWRR